MIRIGNFFFKYRNFLFIFLYLALFIPSAPLFGEAKFGHHYYLFPIILGLLITGLGQLIRGITISLAYIVRGGKDKKVYAEELVITGIFAHCRNPLYVGNILMLLGVGILINSLLFVAVFMPVFLFIYQCIVLAEEHFLRSKFGQAFDDYRKRAHRWLINLNGISQTFAGMEFKGKRWLIKEYNTQTVWILAIVIILLFQYPQLTGYNDKLRNYLFGSLLFMIGCYYFSIRYLKKSGKWRP